MAEHSKIEWTQVTWNPVTGCSKVSPGCNNCYAETMSRRLSNNPKYALATKDDGTWSGVVSCHEDLLDHPLRWKKPRTIFVCSMSDLFHSQVPWDFIGKVFDTMIACPQHTFQLLTKRPGRMAFWADNMAKVCEERGLLWAWPPNVWAGTSVESQKYAPRLDCLARVPASARFVSVEPMLGSVDLKPWLCICRQCTFPRPGESRCGSGLSWVIVGAESGPGATPMNLAWPRSLRVQCKSARVPFFMKQVGRHPIWDGEGPVPADHVYLERLDSGGWRLDLLRDSKGGDPAEWPEDLRIREMPNV